MTNNRKKYFQRKYERCIVEIVSRKIKVKKKHSRQQRKKYKMSRKQIVFIQQIDAEQRKQEKQI